MHWKTRINNFLGNMPVLGKYFPTFRPGHYYSPVVDKREVSKYSKTIFDKSEKTIDGININESEQLALLNQFWPHFKSLPYKPSEKTGKRYYFPNPFFP